MGKIIKPDFSADGFYDRAVDKIKNNDLISAIGDLWAAHKREPEANDILLDIADTYLSLGLYERALKTYFTVLERDRKVEDAYVGIIQAYMQLDRKEMALFYLTMGLDEGALSEDFELDESEMKAELAEDAIFIDTADQEKPRLKIIDKLDRSQSVITAKQMIAGGNNGLARKILEEVPEKSAQFVEAQKTLAALDYAAEKYDTALGRIEKLFKDGISDTFVCSIGLACYHRVGNEKRRNELAQKLDEMTVTDKNELYRIAVSFAETGDDARAAVYFKRLCEQMPNERDVTLCCSLANYNIGNRAYAERLISRLRRLYPDDTVVAYYARHIKEGGVKRIPVAADLPEGEKLRRLHRIEEALSSLKEIELVEIRTEEDEELREMLKWLFRYSNLTMAAHVADFMCQSERWQEYFKEMLLEPLLPAVIKKDYLISYLKCSECKSFCLLVGDIFQRFSVRKPKLTDTPLLAECFYETYATLAFVSVEFSKKLNKAYKALVTAALAREDKDAITDKAVICAALCYLSKPHRIFESKVSCCEIFNCEIDSLNAYLYRLELEKPKDKGVVTFTDDELKED